ncbi:hypothetical protein P879_06950 [Paragonimus westermani]|uniref:Protein prenyltransferase alpha subunit repeat containing protein 1 n=1 Tax=Paragonimus westermani TaxID=34504 RepID=A0A8T0DDB2_9TREM|nr:hypothetical protein P879_06950 [Paragonimus westermani]
MEKSNGLHPSLTYLLVISPNTTTFWNYRRRAIQSNGASIHRELWLTKLILQTHPRSNETIFHRRWIVQHHLAQDMCALMSELDLCDQIAGRYRMHYGLWEYRRFILHHLGSQAYATELERVDKWLQYHPTDSSGWSYLTHLFQLMISDTVMFSSPDMQQLLVQRLKQTSDTLQLYPERECLWIFRIMLRIVVLWGENDAVVALPNASFLGCFFIQCQPCLERSTNYRRFQEDKRDHPQQTTSEEIGVPLKQFYNAAKFYAIISARLLPSGHIKVPVPEPSTSHGIYKLPFYIRRHAGRSPDVCRRNLLLFLHKLAGRCGATNLDWDSVEPLFSRVHQVVSLALTDCIRFQSVDAFIDWCHSHALLSFSDRLTWHQVLWSRQLLWLTQNLTESRSPS